MASISVWLLVILAIAVAPDAIAFSNRPTLNRGGFSFLGLNKLLTSLAERGSAARTGSALNLS